MALATIDPASGQLRTTFSPFDAAELEDRLRRSAAAFASYRTTTFSQRAAWMRAVADLIDEETPTTAALLTLEMGKTIRSARAELAKCAAGCRYYAENAERMLATEDVDADAVKATRAYVRWEPLGPVLAVMPWNFPMWQVIRFAAPALMAGNTALLKHASNVPQTALHLEDLFRRGGFPQDVFSTLLIGSDQVEPVLRDDRVRAVSLTGSTAAGRSVAALAGEVLKPAVLELGGSDPFLVMPSADLEQAAEAAATARCQNNGQSCIAAKRFLVHRDVADRFEALFRKALGSLVVGDPMQEGTDVGPLATERGREDVEELVQDAVDKGATVVLGGERPSGPGWFYPPTLLTGVTRDMRMHTEEVFGPVAQLHRVADLDEALALANDSAFGLGSNAWTNDPAEQERCAKELQAGMVFLNGMTTSYPELPFGGIKGSGYGRELGELGIRAFCNAKTVWVGESSSGDTTTARPE